MSHRIHGLPTAAMVRCRMFGSRCQIGSAIISIAFSLGIDVFSAETRLFYIDSIDGNDSSSGHSESTPWKTLVKVAMESLKPGDHIRFKRGSNFEGTLVINESGSQKEPITLSDYGAETKPAPRFTNKKFDPEQNEFGNCIRLKGSNIVVSNLFFHETVAELSGRIGFTTMWELGAVYIDKDATNCVVVANEFVDCGVGIKSYGEHALIQSNYLHDCNRILKEWNWGPIAIWLGGDHQEVSHNRIVNYSVVDPRINWGPNGYGSGADGSAIEIDDARVPKSNIAIHHNFTSANQGFLEVTWADVERNPPYTGFRIHHNISDDYQQFIALWRGAHCQIDHNTIIRRRRNANEWGVFNITQFDSRNLFRNNIIVVENDVVVFNVGQNKNAKPNSVIEHNLYFAAEGTLQIGLEGPGRNPVFGDPQFTNYNHGEEPDHFSIKRDSPAANTGLTLNYPFDFEGTKIPNERRPTIGAFESNGKDGG